jgi:putative transposase
VLREYEVMPRQARLDTPGVVHHIMIRGVQRRKIFVGDGESSAFEAVDKG